MNCKNRFSILSNVQKGDLRLTPFPHIVIENALDADVFATLAATFPDDALVVDDRPVHDTWYDYPACKVVGDRRVAPEWREFFRYHTSAEFFAELVEVAGPALVELNPDLERRVGRKLRDFKVGMRPGGRGDPLAPGADVSMECQFYVNYTRAPRTVRGPHVDRPSELFAALLYFRQDGDASSGADLQVCEPVAPIFPTPRSVRIDTLPAEIDPRKVKTVATGRYAANTLVLFLNSPRSLHAVSPRSPTPLTRRHINFCADMPFDLFEMKLPQRMRLKKAMERAPFLWRLARHL